MGAVQERGECHCSHTASVGASEGTGSLGRGGRLPPASCASASALTSRCWGGGGCQNVTPHRPPPHVSKKGLNFLQLRGERGRNSIVGQPLAPPRPPNSWGGTIAHLPLGADASGPHEWGAAFFVGDGGGELIGRKWPASASGSAKEGPNEWASPERKLEGGARPPPPSRGGQQLRRKGLLSVRPFLQCREGGVPGHSSHSATRPTRVEARRGLRWSSARCAPDSLLRTLLQWRDDAPSPNAAAAAAAAALLLLPPQLHARCHVSDYPPPPPPKNVLWGLGERDEGMSVWPRVPRGSCALPARGASFSLSDEKERFVHKKKKFWRFIFGFIRVESEVLPYAGRVLGRNHKSHLHLGGVIKISPPPRFIRFVFGKFHVGGGPAPFHKGSGVRRGPPGVI